MRIESNRRSDESRYLPEASDEPGKFIGTVSVNTGELDKLAGSIHDRALVWCSRNGDSLPPSKLKNPLIAQLAQCTQHGVLIHACNGG